MLHKILLAVLAGSPGLLGAAVDVTTLGVIPDDGFNDSPAIVAALVANRELYFPPGEYTLNSTIYVPSNSTILGAGMDETVFRLGTDTVAFRCEGTTAICFQAFEMVRPFNNSREEFIFVYQGASHITVAEVRCRENTSRAPSLHFFQVDNCTVVGCETIDDQRQIFEEGQNQVYGSGITFNGCDGVLIAGNRVTQPTDLRIMDNSYQNYYQSGGIQTSSCSDVMILYNYVWFTGNGIDSGGTTNALIEGNVVDDVHQAGIKLVNGSTQQTVRGNFVARAGIVGIWLSPGTTNLPITNCLVEDNTLARIGDGMGKDWWDGIFSNTIPAGIHIDVASSSAGRSHDITVQNNLLYNSPETAFAYIVRPGTNMAYDVTLSNNQTTNDPPPLAPNPDPYPYNLCIDPAARAADWSVLER